MFKQNVFKNFKIATKLSVCFLLMAAVPLLFWAYISYTQAKKALKQEIINSLSVIADSKAHQIESYILENEKDITTLAQTPIIVDIFEKFDQAFMKGGLDSPEYIALDKKLRPFLTYYQESFGFSDLLLVCPHGDLFFSVAKGEDLGTQLYTGIYKDSELAKVYDRAKTLLTTEIADFEYYSATNEPASFIAAPVLKKRNLIGVIIFRISNEKVYKLINDYTGLGKTGETIIALEKGNKAVFISPVRHDPHAAFRKKIPIGSLDGLPIQKAVQGKKGVGVFRDCRGKEVLSVWRYLPHLRWGMVVKIDAGEAFAPVLKLRNWSLIIGIIALLGVALISLVVSKLVSAPVVELTEKINLIATGLSISKINIKSKDEIGELADSFNAMNEDLKSARESLEKRMVELKKANHELDSFVYTASHDLRAPLRAISSFSSFLEEDYKDKLDEEGNDYLKEIRKGANRMSDLIEDLLALSRISRIKNPYENVDMNDLINSVLKRIEFDINKYKVNLKIQQNLPTVSCDRIKIAEAFLNLISNAIKFSSKDNKENSRIEIGYADKGAFYEFFVKDNGIGIDQKYHQQIFGIFKRLHTDNEYEGTGAGLAIVKRIIDDHYGNIRIESELGKGTIFYFTIPKSLKKKKKIGEILVEHGRITKEQLEKDLKKQQNEQV